MTPEEKAKELVSKYKNAPFNCVDCEMLFCEIKCTMLSNEEAKECALIAVDEILNCPAMNDCEQVKYKDGSYAREYYEVPNKFWSKVKNEIKKL